MNKITGILLCLSALTSMLFFPVQPAHARDWDDLYEKTSESLYGSEKAEKMPVDIFIYQKEDWKDHYSNMVFGFYKFTDYPKYTSMRVIPFWYGLDSKIDNRSFGLIPLFLTYWETDGSVHKRYNPLFFDVKDTDAGTLKKRYERTNFSLLHYYEHYDEKDGYFDTTIWFPIVPIFYRNNTASGGHQNLLYFIDYTWNTADNKTSIDRFWVVPLFFHRAGKNGYTVLTPLIVDNRHTNGERYSHFLPFFIYDKTISAEYVDKKLVSEYTRTWYTLPFMYSQTDEDTWGGKTLSSQLNIPIVPVLYYAYDKKGGESTRNILLVNWHRDKNQNLDRFWLSPILFWKSNTYFHLPPVLYFYYKDTFQEYNNDSKTNETRYSTLHLNPVFTSYTERRNSHDGEEIMSRTLFPIIPVLYYSYKENGVESQYNILLTNWHRDKDGRMDRFWFSPLFFWKENSYMHFFPPVVMNFYSSFTEKDKDSGAERKMFSSLLFSPLYTSYNERKNSPDGEETMSRTLFPIIPVLYYSYKEKGVESQYNIALANWHRDKDGRMDRFWFSPLFFWKENSYMHFFPPVVMNFYSSFTEKDKDSGAERKIFSSLLLSPVYTSYIERKNSPDGEEIVSRTLFPIIPVLYYSYKEKGGESTRNILLANWHKDKNDRMDRFWISPLLYWKENSYMHILPPVVMNFSGKDYSYTHVLPIYFGYDRTIIETDPATNSERTLSAYSQVTPFFVRHNEYNDKNENVRSRFFFPIIPLYYSYYNETGVHKNAAWLVDWALNKEGSLERFWTIPFVFWKAGEGGYKIAAPFYFKPSGWSETKGYSFGLFHYNSWSPEQDTTVIWPAFYYLNDNRAEKSYTKVCTPFYWNFETEARNTKLVLPLWFDTTDNKTGKSFYINIAGLTKSVASGPNPKVDFDAGKSEYGYFIDTDVSWLYDVFSVSWRGTVYKTAEKKIETTGNVSLEEKSWISRDDSVNYFGWRMLFGLVDYKAADSKRHFRWLPFMWMSWDTLENDDNYWFLTYHHSKGKNYSSYMFIPVFYSYSSPEQDQFLIFPVYGSQNIGNSYTYAFLLNALWIEYDDEKKMYEKTVLWPFINWYSSPEKSGGRFAPFFWHKRWIENEKESSRWIVLPLLYHRSSSLVSNGETSDIFSISPVHYYAYEKDGDKTESRWFYPLIPLRYYSKIETKDKSETTSWIFPFYFGGEHAYTENNIAVNQNSTFIPLLLHYSSSRTETSQGNSPKEYSHSFTAGLYRSSTPEESYWTFLGLVSGTSANNKPGGETNLLFGLFSNSYGENTHHNRFLPFWWYDSSANGYSLYAAIGLFHQSRDADAFKSRLFPFYSYESSPDSRGLSILLGLFGTEKNTKTNYSSTTFLWHLAGTDSGEHEYLHNNKKRIMKEESTWLIPLGFGYASYDKDDESIFYEHSQWTLFHHYNSEKKNGSALSATWWAPVIPLVYHFTDSDYTHTNALLLFDYSSSRKEDYKKFWAVPVFFAKSGAEGYLSILPPVFTHWWDEKAQESSYFALGFYKTSSPDYERQNFLYLFDHIKNLREKSESYGMLFNILGKSENEKETEYSLLWGAGARYRSFKGNDDYELSAICSIVKFQRSEDYYHSRLLPLWYYERNRGETTLVIPPLLAYDNEKADGSQFSLWGAGLAYYRNKDTIEKTDNQKVLLGIAYDRVSEPERGYTSKGVLWGFLYEYKEETETDYEEYSVLKGILYKRTHLKGETKDRILFISF